VKDAVLRAGNDLKFKSYYRTTQTLDLEGMSKLIYQAIQEKPDGLVVSMPNPQILGPPVKAAIAAGIPVMTMNSGYDVFQSLGAIHHVGQDETISGYQGCLKLITSNPLIKAILFLDNEAGQNGGINNRAHGCKSAGALHRVNVSQVSVAETLIIQVQQLKTMYLPELFKLGLKPHQIGMLAGNVMSVRAMGIVAPALKFKPGEIKMGTFDFSQTAAAMQAGNLTFAIHQQQYLQGYLPAVMLAIYASTKNIFAPTFNETGGQIALLSGPMFIEDDATIIHQRGCEANGIIYCDDPAKPDPNINLLYSLQDTTPKCPCIDRSDVKLSFLHHGGTSDVFWQVVKNGAEQAAEDMGVALDLQNPPLPNIAQMVGMGLEMVTQKPDGLITTLPDDSLQPVLDAARLSNITTIVINVGSTFFEEYGAAMFVGQEDFTAGYQSSQKLYDTIQSGYNNGQNYFSSQLFLCLDGSNGAKLSTQAKCNGTRHWLVSNNQQVPPFLQGITSPPGMVYLDSTNPAGSQSTLENYFAALAVSCKKCKVTGLIAVEETDCHVATQALDLLKASGKRNPFYVACFNYGPNQRAGLLSGDVQFETDQQPWLQGYFPVMFLAMKKLSGNILVPYNSILPTGPVFPDKAEVPYKQCENMVGTNQHFVGWAVCPNQFTLSYFQTGSIALPYSVYALAALQFVVLCSTSIIFFYHRKTKLMQASSMIFCQIMLFFMALMLVCACLFATEPSKDHPLVCGSRPIVMAISLLGVLSPLFAKTLRLVQIFHNSGMKKIKISNKKLALEIVKAFSGATVILIAWFILDAPFTSEVAIASKQYSVNGIIGTTTIHDVQCHQRMVFVWVLAAYILAYVLYGSSLAYKVRNVPEIFNESKSIGICLYCFLIIGAMVMALLAIVRGNRTAVTVLISYGLLIVVLIFWAVLFATKLETIFQGRADQLVSATQSAAVYPLPLPTSNQNLVRAQSSADHNRLSRISSAPEMDTTEQQKTVKELERIGEFAGVCQQSFGNSITEIRPT